MPAVAPATVRFQRIRRTGRRQRTGGVPISADVSASHSRCYLTPAAPSCVQIVKEYMKLMGEKMDEDIGKPPWLPHRWPLGVACAAAISSPGPLLHSQL